MSDGHLKLSVFSGERDMLDGRPVCETVTDAMQAAGLPAAILVRGVSGFGAKHHLHTDRVLTLSEDLPMVNIGVGLAATVDALAHELADRIPGGLIALERVRTADRPPPHAGGSLKLTVYLAHGGLAVTQVLRDAGLDGAIVLAGLDGVLHGRRARARLMAPARGVPSMVIAMGGVGEILDACARLPADVGVVTLEDVHVLKRDGVTRAEPPARPHGDDRGLGVWQRFVVLAGDRDRHHGAPLHDALIRRLRMTGADGATCLRGVWGFSHHGAPHGDRLFALQRATPTLTAVLTRPDDVGTVWDAVDAVTQHAGLVSVELVPALRHTTGDGHRGGLRLAHVPPA
ncbi:MAG: DUF190 domain-containing protein [Thermoleophilia bacterium]